MKKSYAIRKKHCSIYFKLFLISISIFLIGMTGLTLNSEEPSIVATSFVNQEIEPIMGEKKLIVIDPGHGGIDAGAVIAEINEKDINLEISLKLKDALEEAGYDVLMTREIDEFIELTERADIANETNADLFISIHLNSYIVDSSVNGVEVYYNEATKSEDDKVLAQEIQSALSDATGARNRGIRAYDELAVTRKTVMPACLVEMAFMTNEQELALVQTEDYQQKIVSGIVAGVVEFFNHDSID